MLRTLFKSDIHQLLTIEKTVHVAPWTEETFQACLKSGYLGWVIDLEGAIIGFVITSHTADECHVLNIGVARSHQHQGWGRKLMEQTLSHAKQQGIDIIYLEVRRSNSKAIALYRKMRFQLVGERKDYYPTVVGHEDALIFAKSLKEAP